MLQTVMPYFRDSELNFSDATDIQCRGCNSWIDTSLSECYFCGTKIFSTNRAIKKYQLVEREINGHKYKTYELIDNKDTDIPYHETAEEKFIEMLLKD